MPSPLHLVWTQPRPSVFTFAVAMVLALVGVVWMAYNILYHGVPGSAPLYLLIAAVGGLFVIWIVCKFCVPISVYTEGDSVIIARSRVLLRIGLCTRHPIRDIRHIALDYQQTSDWEGSKRIRWSVMIVSRQRTSTYVLSRGSDARGLAEALGSVVRRENEGEGGEPVSPDPRTRIGSRVDRTPEQDRTGTSPPRTPDELVVRQGLNPVPSRRGVADHVVEVRLRRRRYAASSL